MSRLSRYVGRARGSALRAAGVPRTPNLPSARAYARRAVSGVVGSPLPGRNASSVVPATGGRPTRRRPAGGLPVLLGVVALALAVYLLAYDAPPPPSTRPAVTCADRVVYHRTHLRDC